MPLVNVEPGIDIWYEEYGSGDRYLLCTKQHHYRDSVEKELAKRGFHVYLLTNRGYGRSTHVTENYPDHWYDKFADDVVHFADKMGIDKFCYSGASHGAGTGWHIALNYPERLICFFAAVPGPHSLDEGSMSFKKMIELGLIENKPLNAPTDDERLIRRRELRQERIDEEMAQPDYEEIYESPESKAINYGRPLTAYGNEENLKKALSTIKTPVLIMGGTEDNISRTDLMMRTAHCLENCKTVIYSGFGHGLDIYEEMANECVRFYENYISTGYYYDPVEVD